MNISFKAQLIKPTYIKHYKTEKGVYTPKIISFIELDAKNKDDLLVIKELATNWGKDNLVKDILKSLSKRYQRDTTKVFALTEQRDFLEKPNSKQVLGIAMTDTFYQNACYLEYLQTNPLYMANKKMAKFKNIGSTMLKLLKNKFWDQEIRINALEESVGFYLKNCFKQTNIHPCDLYWNNKFF